LLLPANSSDQNLRSIRATAAHLRRIGAGTFDQLNEAIGQICELFTQKNAETSSTTMNVRHKQTETH
jgi:hypothetical protein